MYGSAKELEASLVLFVRALIDGVRAHVCLCADVRDRADAETKRPFSLFFFSYSPPAVCLCSLPHVLPEDTEGGC